MDRPGRGANSDRPRGRKTHAQHRPPGRFRPACRPCPPPGLGAEESWPARPVRLIVPYPPGGGADIVARLLAPALAEQPGGPQIVIDNRPGANGNIGTEALAKSPPDGYTLGTITIGTHGTNPWLYPRAGFDPQTDFTPLALVSLQPGGGGGRRRARRCAAWTTCWRCGGRPISAHPATAPAGTWAGEVLRAMGRLPLLHVPYRGSGPAWADLLGGRVELVVDNIQNALPHHQAGRVRILGLTGIGPEPRWCRRCRRSASGCRTIWCSPGTASPARPACRPAVADRSSAG